MKSYRLLISPCPNDTYIFYALIHRKIDTRGLDFEVEYHDIKELNEKAEKLEGDIIKVSFYAYALLQEQYYLLKSGAALGKGCGPLLVTRKKHQFEPTQTIAIPGKNTTANFLMSYYLPEAKNKKEMLFHEIMPAIVQNHVDAGVIIHESRFTYQNQGLVCVQDLGEYWETRTGLPIPLGGIIAKKTFSDSEVLLLENLIYESICYANEHQNEVLKFCQQHAQEMDFEVMLSHIQLYVNEFSKNLGQEGFLAIQEMMKYVSTGFKV